MIVSDFESFALRLLLGGAIDADRRGRYAEVRGHVNALLEWCERPGVTVAGQCELKDPPTNA